jgi:hypothetical protein
VHLKKGRLKQQGQNVREDHAAQSWASADEAA